MRDEIVLAGLSGSVILIFWAGLIILPLTAGVTLDAFSVITISLVPAFLTFLWLYGT